MCVRKGGGGAYDHIREVQVYIEWKVKRGNSRRTEIFGAWEATLARGLPYFTCEKELIVS